MGTVQSSRPPPGPSQHSRPGPVTQAIENFIDNGKRHNRVLYSHPNGDPNHFDNALRGMEKSYNEIYGYLAPDAHSIRAPVKYHRFVGSGSLPPHRLPSSHSTVRYMLEPRSLNY